MPAAHSHPPTLRIFSQDRQARREVGPPRGRARGAGPQEHMQLPRWRGWPTWELRVANLPAWRQPQASRPSARVVPGIGMGGGWGRCSRPKGVVAPWGAAADAAAALGVRRVHPADALALLWQSRMHVHAGAVVISARTRVRARPGGKAGRPPSGHRRDGRFRAAAPRARANGACARCCGGARKREPARALVEGAMVRPEPRCAGLPEGGSASYRSHCRRSPGAEGAGGAWRPRPCFRGGAREHRRAHV